MSACKQIYDEKKKTTVNICLKKVTPHQNEPEAGPSGGIPEEGIVFLEEGSSMHVKATGDQCDNM